MNEVTGKTEGECLLVGVCLIPDISQTTETSTNLGVILTNNETVLAELKKNILEQLLSVPDSFCFCSKQGWSMDDSLEDRVKLKDILTDSSEVFIKRKYVHPKVGIRLQSGQVVGFIFTDFSKHLDLVRGDIHNLIFPGKREDMTFSFLDPNNWPVTQSQERSLHILDILCGSCLTIRVNNDDTRCLSASGEGDNAKNVECLSLKGTRVLSFRTSKDLDRGQLGDYREEERVREREILISYVRAEAADHALTLKQELSCLGFSVYLDVHEIKSGVDWQDSLNYAVSNCEIFVPLVTSRYGETQWTNREVKLADVLGKLIIPVNFLEEWPPRCLAIQFSTVQYINTISGVDGSTRLREVAIQIKGRIQKSRQEEGNVAAILNEKPSLIKRRTIVKSCAMVQENNDQAVTTDRDGRPLVVVCVHPTVSKQGKEMKQWLVQQNYDVWMSSDIQPELQIPAYNVEEFQERADEAGVVLVLLSKEFINSRSCLQQLYYCEQRKRIIAVKLEEMFVPGWLEMLVGSSPIQLFHDKERTSLQRELRRNLDLTARMCPRAEICEARINCAVRQLQKVINVQQCIYVTGSVKLSSVHQQTLCSIIGSKLCELSDITMVTGGFYGTEYNVGKSFHEAACRNMRSNKVWHILPEKDSQDLRSEAAQNTDGSFQILDYGQTYFCGESVEDRDSIVARAFDTCLVVLGDERCDHMIQKFIWNDHNVIPVQITNTAKKMLPDKLFDVPRFVNENDWKNLNLSSVSTNVIGQSLQRIVATVQSNLKKEESDNLMMCNIREGCGEGSPPRKKLKGSTRTSPAGQKTSLATSKTVIL